MIDPLINSIDMAETTYLKWNQREIKRNEQLTAGRRSTNNTPAPGGNTVPILNNNSISLPSPPPYTSPSSSPSNENLNENDRDAKRTKI
jgi:hypothetical protein